MSIESKKQRLLFLDNMKVLFSILVAFKLQSLKRVEGPYNLKSLTNKLVTKKLKTSIRDCF
ncbi:MAG: hypothetical protein ACFE9Z_14015 [Promethearchaeota archaeon]